MLDNGRQIAEAGLEGLRRNNAAFQRMLAGKVAMPGQRAGGSWQTGGVT